MFDWLRNLMGRAIELWTNLPETSKEKVIELIVETFDALLRAFFRASKKNPEKS